jgi:hypothetical protein
LDRRRRRRLIAGLAPRLDSLVARLDDIPSNLLDRDFRETKDLFLNSLATLKGRNDSIINICPKCHDTLTVRTTSYHGRIFGCPNYPQCGHLIKVANLNSEVFEHLRVE